MPRFVKFLRIFSKRHVDFQHEQMENEPSYDTLLLKTTSCNLPALVVRILDCGSGHPRPARSITSQFRN